MKKKTSTKLLKRKVVIRIPRFNGINFVGNWTGFKANWLFQLLQVAELVIAFIALVNLIGNPGNGSIVKNWVAFAGLLLGLRIARVFFFGFSQLPSVSYDLPLLTSLTLLLVVTIVQGNERSYISLGGSSDSGVGVLLVAGLSVYLFNLAGMTRNGLRGLIAGLQFGMLGAVLFELSKSYNRLSSEGMLVAILLVIFSTWLISQYRHFFWRAASFAGIFLGAGALLGRGNAVDLLLFVTASLMLLVWQFAYHRRGLVKLLNTKTKEPLAKLGELTSNVPALPLSAFGVIALVGLFALAVFAKASAPQLAGVFSDYSAVVNDLRNNTRGLLLGLGPISSDVSAVNLLKTYGIAGLAVVLALLGFFVVKLLRSHANAQTAYSRSAYAALLAMLAFGVAGVLATNVSPIIFVILSGVFAVAHSLGSVEPPVGKLVTYRTFFSRPVFTRIMPIGIWQELFGAIRLLVVALFLAALPRALQFIQSLY